MYQLPELVRQVCESMLEADIKEVHYVGGGDINEARCLHTSRGEVFLKMNAGTFAGDMFLAESKGLTLLSGTGAVRVPKALGHGRAGPTSFLLLEFIPTARPGGDFWPVFGRALADLHRCTGNTFGLDFDNFIGSLPQRNRQHESWADFFIRERIDPQVRQAYEQAFFSLDDMQTFERLYQRLAEIFPPEAPSLVHGDLWGGNYLCDTQNRPVLIDPAVSYSHRELDLAMTRLFGGFAPDFYQAYHEHFPLAPGWEDRLEIGQLYYLLAHVNLFGGGYVQSVRRILRRFK